MDADDPIPVDAIGLVEAYQLTRSAHIPDWDRLANRITSNDDDPWWSVDLAERVVERFFRDALAKGELNAYVRDPISGERLQLLNRDDWSLAGFLPGISSNFTSPNDLFCPGPDSTIDGMRRPVFVIKKELDTWRKFANGMRKKGGRTPHDWETIEKKVFELMDYHGDFSLTDRDWNAQARLEDKITDEFGIGHTQLRAKLPKMLERWRAGKIGK
jgi:hypothetical protein